MVTHKNHCLLHYYHGSPQEMDTLNYEALNKLAGTFALCGMIFMS